MSDTGNDDRRSFTSRTPANTNPDRVTYRRGFVTRHQVTGWRFVMRRIASGVALHDTRMLVDPLRTQSRSVLMGALIVVTGVLGCFVFSLIRPGGVPGNDAVLADRDTAALYIRVNDELHPVLNLTSARLITGRPDNPTQVKSSELDKFPRGALIGIPGAPERMVQGGSPDGDWTVCEGAADTAGVSVIAGTPVTDGERATRLPAGDAVLVDSGAGTSLLWDGRRSPIDLADRAVTSALGFGADNPPARPIAPGLFNAIPEGAPLRAPAIPGAGGPPQYALSVPAPVGSVVVAYGPDSTLLSYAVLSDGLQPVSPVLASILRNANSFGLQQPPRLAADEIARTPVSRVLDTAAYPATDLNLVDPKAAPVTCVRWTKPLGAQTSSLSLLSGSKLPVGDDAHAVTLFGVGATRAYLTPGVGYLTQTVGQEAAAPRTGSLFWVSDTGVRFGIDGGTEKDGAAKAITALGLTEPATPAPWSVLSLLTAGPALSKSDALTAYTGTENR
ncbi:MAG: type VII secretion protein EccB [Mycobacterium sp.]|nr:type VII secretion protein EccB [Mycobacterium sp.]